jgi:hypothetical protein
MPSAVMVAAQRLRSHSHLIVLPSISIREMCTVPRLS